MNKFFERVDPRYAKVCIYASATVLLTAAVFMILLSASPVIATIWNLACAVLEPMIYGAAFSYIINPLVKRVSTFLRERKLLLDNPEKRRAVSVIISMVLIALFLLAIVFLLLLMITHSLASLNWNTIQDLIGDFRGNFSELLSRAEEMLQSWGVLSTGGDSVLLTAFNGVTNAASTILFAVIFCVYFLIDGPRVSEYLARLANALFRHGTHIDIKRLATDADRVFSGYFRGQGVDALIVGVLSGVVLTAIGVPYGPVIGLLTGLANLIPYLGGPVGFGSVVLMCAPTGDWAKMIAGLIAMAVVMFVDGNIINPRLLSNSVEVHPILVVAALIAGGAVGGIAGMLVAVPTAAFLKIQLDRWIEKREREAETEQQLEAEAAEQETAKTSQGTTVEAVVQK